MEMIPITPERKAQLDEYARRHDQDSAAALDEVLSAALAWEQQDFDEAVQGIHEGYEEMKAGRTQSVEEMLEELRTRHGLPR